MWFKKSLYDPSSINNTRTRTNTWTLVFSLNTCISAEYNPPIHVRLVICFHNVHKSIAQTKLPNNHAKIGKIDTSDGLVIFWQQNSVLFFYLLQLLTSHNASETRYPYQKYQKSSTNYNSRQDMCYIKLLWNPELSKEAWSHPFWDDITRISFQIW